LKTEGNLNNHIGVPLTLFKVTAIHEVAVVEIGTNHFGEIAYLCEILEPDFCVMTNIGREHLEFFKDVEGVAKAEAELFSYIEKANKFACINGDDAWIVKTSQAIKDKITYGFSNTFDIHATFLGLDTMAMPEFKIAYKGQETYMKLKVPGEHAVSNAIAAFAIGVVLDVSPSQIKKGLEDYQAFSKRMEVIQKNGVTIINDCYNANPDSMLAALKTLSQIKTSGKRIAVLGDMAELGERSRDAHHEMGQTIINSGIDCLYTVGKDIELTTLAAGKTMKEAHHFEGKESLIEYLKNLVAKKDVLLVKGSRSMKLEEVLDALFPVV
jgi:UDP-N-acetylmuramoyl-tripeptide--D-alanyl-D-alanine ligase